MAMTGNVGSQTAMIITRGLAVGLVGLENLGRTVLREFFVGCLMGIAAGVLVGLFSLWRYDHAILGLALTLSMISSMTSAACVGALAPALFKKVGIDPAIAAGPLVTTTCDVLGVGIYLVVALMVIS
jgi:magnesium transporter